MKVNFDINYLVIIGILIIVVLLVCFKCLDLQTSIKEGFEENNNNNTNNANNTNNVNSNNTNKKSENNVGNNEENTSNNVGNNANNSGNNANNNNLSIDGLDEDEELILEINDDILDMENSNSISNEPNSVESLSNSEKAELIKQYNELENKAWGSIISKHTGKTINVEEIGERDGNKLYMIKWKPLGGKPGGCFTLEADGTYSTPLCNPNIDKQKWMIKKITSENVLREVIPKDRQSMGRAFEETAFPFYMVLSNQDSGYCLNYEGGGLSIRPTANYDGQKWDVSEKKIQQDPLPTQNNNKYTSLTTGHNMGASDNGAMGSNGANGANGANDSNGGNGAVNLNVNLDPDLLARLGLMVGSDGSLQNSNQKLNGSTNGDMDGFFDSSGDNVDELLVSGHDNPNCPNCNKIPERYISKDLVKATCIGCDNIDNVLT